MARLKMLNVSSVSCTDERAQTQHASPELQLRRVLLTCLRRKRKLREDDAELCRQIAELVPKVDAAKVAALAIEGSGQMRLHHMPLLLVREMARHKTHRALVADTLARVIQGPDALIDFVAIYWKDGRVPLSAQVKRGLAAAFPKFDEHALAKCKKGGPIKLRDVLFLCHATPRDDAQAGVWKKLIWGRMTKQRRSGAREG